MKLLDVLHSPWAITRESLLEIKGIVDTHLRGEAIDIGALEAKIGRPLQNTQGCTLRGSIALLNVTGPIFRYANLMTDVSGACSLGVLAKEFSAAEESPSVSQIVMVLDTPGGQANGIAEFAQMVANCKKPVTCYVENVAASAGYWLASACDRIVMAKTAVVGSIGAVMSIDRKSEDGCVEFVSSQSPKKRADVTTDAGAAQMQELVDGLAQVFVEDVAAYRKCSVDTVLRDFGAGGMKLAAEAVAVGMADSIGTLETLLAELSAAPATQGALRMNKDQNQELTLEALRAAQPALCAQLIEEGAARERERIASIEALAMPGHDKLIAALKADGKTTSGEAAIQILAAERAKLSAIADRLHADAPKPVPHASATSAKEDADTAAPGDDRMALHRKARAYQDAHPGTDYRAALQAVCPN